MPPAAEGTLAALLQEVVGPGRRLVLASNRGPLTFEAVQSDARSGRARGGSAGADDAPFPHTAALNGDTAGDGSTDGWGDGVALGLGGTALTATRGSGGLVTALAELGSHAPITWVAAALGEGDRLAAAALRGHGPEHDAITRLVAQELPGQDLRLALEALPPEMYEPYYRVVANPFLWFLQHQMYALPYAPNVDGALLEAWRTGYRPANAAFANRIAAEADSDDPIVLLQDYHLYLAASYVRERLPRSTILHFTHIPWPSSSQWQVLPQGLRLAICEGLLACDIVGLQTDRYADAFLDTVASFVHDAYVDRDGRNVRWRGRRIRVRSYPIAVDPGRLDTLARSPGVEERLAKLQARIERAGRPKLVVRADRMEPSKNSLRGFLAFEELLERRPDLRPNVRFVAVHAPTRTELPEYNEYARVVREVVARINGMGDPDEQPVWLYDGSDYDMVIAALRAADVVLVNPVLDGMNLVAKEAALVGDRDPVLILSETAGAAEQLGHDALTVAPADVVGTADLLERGLEMGQGERHIRARRLRARVRREDLSWWLGRQLRDLAAIRRGQMPPSRRLHDTVRGMDREGL